MNRHLVVVLLSLVPFAISSFAAVAIWESSEVLLNVWRLVFAASGWVVAFAAGTKLFWEVVVRLAPR